MTVALIVLGAFSEMLLKKKGILCASRILSVGQITDSTFIFDDMILEQFGNDSFPVYNEETKAKMTQIITEAAKSGDSLGGVSETYISHVPAGLGEPFFDSAESLISHLAFSAPGVKGIEFGGGFALAKETGSRANDAMRYENETLRYLSNHSGGISGGITNGNLIVFRTAFKPTPSISLPQETVNFETKTNVKLSIEGRHDTIIALKGLHVMTAVAQYAISEMMLEYGYE
jgi:chorismate synthase